ncbi:transposase [Streptomyces subrutilus]|uniref:transposase n=1 Tax=Streptomyces subrutilus TaxID=36818 RepID=UPI003F541F01
MAGRGELTQVDGRGRPWRDHRQVVNTKVDLAVDGRGLPLSIVLTPGNVNDATAFGQVLDGGQACEARAARRWAAAERSTPAAEIAKPTPISMHTAHAYDGNGSRSRNSGAIVARVATAPTMKTMPPAFTRASPGRASSAGGVTVTPPG